MSLTNLLKYDNISVGGCMQDYTAYARTQCDYLYALTKAGFSIRDIQKMSPEERVELGRQALLDEQSARDGQKNPS